MRSHSIVALSLLTLGAAPVVPAAPATPACFWPSEVSGFSDGGHDRALLRIGTRSMWELTVGPGCPNIDYALQIGIRARGGQRICTGRPAELIVPYPGTGSRNCLVRNIRRLPDAEAAREMGLTSRPKR